MTVTNRHPRRDLGDPAGKIPEKMIANPEIVMKRQSNVIVLPAGPYSIGSNHWPGVSKILEESGELNEILGKLIGANGKVEHFSGINLRERMIEEIADLRAALEFFVDVNGLPWDEIQRREAVKRMKFDAWHREGLEFARQVPEDFL